MVNLRMETAARFGNNRKLFRLLYEATIAQRMISEMLLIAMDEFFEAKVNHDASSVAPEILDSLIEPYLQLRQKRKIISIIQKFKANKMVFGLNSSSITSSTIELSTREKQFCLLFLRKMTGRIMTIIEEPAF